MSEPFTVSRIAQETTSSAPPCFVCSSDAPHSSVMQGRDH